MEGFGIFIIVLLGGAVLMLCCVALSFKIRAFREETYYIKLEIARSDEGDERKYWQRKLEKHYARLIPFYRKKHK